MALENITKYNTCCCKSRRELVADNSENVTPVKPERKSRVFSCDEKNNSIEGEATNLLTPSTSMNRNSRSRFIIAFTNVILRYFF